MLVSMQCTGVADDRVDIADAATDTVFRAPLRPPSMQAAGFINDGSRHWSTLPRMRFSREPRLVSIRAPVSSTTRADITDGATNTVFEDAKAGLDDEHRRFRRQSSSIFSALLAHALFKRAKACLDAQTGVVKAVVEAVDRHVDAVGQACRRRG